VGSSSIDLNDVYLVDIILLFTFDLRVMNLILVFDHQSIML